MRSILVLMLSLFLLGCEGSDGEEKTAFMKCVEEAGITDVEKIEKLTCRDEGIASIEEIRSFRSLKELNLASNSISNLSPLSGLQELRLLNISFNKVESISSLAGLINLSDLNIGGNSVKDFSPLSNLINIRHLSIYRYHNSAPLDFLSSLGELRSLTIGTYQLTKEEREIIFSLYSLNTLVYHVSSLTNIEGISNLTNLTTLHINYSNIYGEEAIASLSNLTSLVLQDVPIDDITFVSSLVNLRSLVIQNTQVADLAPVAALNNLKFIWVRDNPIVSGVIELGNLPEIESISLCGTETIPEADIDTLTSMLLNTVEFTHSEQCW